MIALETSAHRKLIASLRLLESDQEGERQAALNAALRLLPPGVNLADVVERGLAGTIPEPVKVSEPWAWTFRHCLNPWRQKARVLLKRPLYFNDRELDFLRDMAARSDEPTTKQANWLNGLFDRVPGGGI